MIILERNTSETAYSSKFRDTFNFGKANEGEKGEVDMLLFIK